MEYGIFDITVHTLHCCLYYPSVKWLERVINFKYKINGERDWNYENISRKNGDIS